MKCPRCNKNFISLFVIEPEVKFLFEGLNKFENSVCINCYSNINQQYDDLFYELIKFNQNKNLDEIPEDIKKYVLRRTSYRCEKCDINGKLDIHHIISRNKNGSNEISNLKVLCRNCHIDEHSNVNIINEV